MKNKKNINNNEFFKKWSKSFIKFLEEQDRPDWKNKRNRFIWGEVD